GPSFTWMLRWTPSPQGSSITPASPAPRWPWSHTGAWCTPAPTAPPSSISIQFTAAAVLLLQQEGKLSLDDLVSRFIPGLTRGNEVTIRELLSHTSGCQDFWPQDYVMPMMLKPTTPQSIADRWAKQPLDFDPG